MSLSIDGVWKAGVWATTVWADGVWFEGSRASTVDTHDGVDEIFRKRDAEIKEQRDRLRRDILAAVERVTGKPPPLDVPLKQLASIARKSEAFNYRAVVQTIERLDQDLAQAKAQREAMMRRIEEEELILLTLQ